MIPEIPTSPVCLTTIPLHAEAYVGIVSSSVIEPIPEYPYNTI